MQTSSHPHVTSIYILYNVIWNRIFGFCRWRNVFLSSCNRPTLASLNATVWPESGSDLRTPEWAERAKRGREADFFGVHFRNWSPSWLTSADRCAWNERTTGTGRSVPALRYCLNNSRTKLSKGVQRFALNNIRTSALLGFICGFYVEFGHKSLKMFPF